MGLKRSLEGWDQLLKFVEGHTGEIQELRRARLQIGELYMGHRWCLLSWEAQYIINRDNLNYTNVYRVFAKWVDDGSLWQAFLASVRHLATEKHLDLRILHGDGTNTVAKKGAMALVSRGTNTRRARKSLPSSTIMAMSSRLSLWLRSMRPTWS